MDNDNKIRMCGRPPGKRKTAKIEISIEPDVKETFMNICYREGTSASIQIYQYIREYIRQYEEGDRK